MEKNMEHELETREYIGGLGLGWYCPPALEQPMLGVIVKARYNYIVAILQRLQSAGAVSKVDN